MRFLWGCAGVWLALLGVSSWAAAWELELPAEGYRAADAPFRIRLPEDLPPDSLRALSLELDGIDVSAMVVLEEGYALFAPPRALEPGPHELRLVEYAADGEIRELALWTVEVQSGTGYRSADWDARADLRLRERIADKGLGDFAGDSTQVQGALGLGGEIAGQRWHLSGQADFLYNRQRELMPGGRHRFDLNSFRFDGRYDQSYLTLGDQVPGTGSLVVGEFHRRGVAAGTRLWGDRLGVQGFSLHTEPLVGHRHGLGVYYPDHRTSGLMLDLQPLAATPLALGVSYISGEGGDSGFGLGGATESPRGEAAGASIDAGLWGRRLRLRGEVARSRVDLDGDGALGAEDDKAWSVLALFTPASAPQLGGEALRWNLGVEQVQVGSYYRSLANPGLPSDRRALRVFGEAAWGGISSLLSLGRETDNVNDFDGVPTTETERLHLQFGWSPLAVGEGGGPFANPAYSAALAMGRQRYRDVPEGSGLELDRLSRDVQLSANFFPGPWSWGLGYAESSFEEREGFGFDSDNRLAFLSVSAPVLRDRLRLSPELQWNELRYPDLDYRLISVYGRLLLEAVLLPQRLNLNLELSLNRERADDDSSDSETRYLQANLNWSLWQPGPRRPGAMLYLSGSYQDRDDRAFDSREHVYQVFVGLDISWAGSSRR